MKYLLVTDTHLGLYGDSDAWHAVVVNLFKDIIDTCHRENISKIIHLGDFFHNRKSINTKTQTVAHGIAAMLDTFHMYVIVGNHDSYYRNTTAVNSLQFLNQYPHIQIVDTPTEVDEDIILVPWGYDIPYKGHKYCMGHFQIQGFHMNDNYTCKSGKDLDEFKEYQQILSGHFHSPSQQGNVIYLGSPYQQTFNDKGGNRGYYTFKNGDLTFYENFKSPKFMEISSESDFGKDLEGNIVKLIFEKDHGSLENQKIIDSAMKMNPMKLTTNFSNVSFVDEEIQLDDEVQLLSHDDIMKEYVQKKCTPPENVEKKILLNIITKFIGEIKDE